MTAPKQAKVALSTAHSRVAGSADPIDVPSPSELRFRAIALRALETNLSQRARMARLLHDEIAQVLSGVGLQLDVMRMDLEGRVPEIAARTAQIQEMLEIVVKQVRDLSYEMNPEIVERAGLRAALDLLVGRYGRAFPGRLRLLYNSSVHVPTEAGVAMQKIAEEALRNAIQHAKCNEIEIIVKPTRGGSALQVVDDGESFDYASARDNPRGLGLLVMADCAGKAGLRLTVTRNGLKGTTVKVTTARHGVKQKSN